MRKVLSIVLALAMVLGCFASVFAAEFTDVKATDDFATAVSVLTDLNVVSGYTDGTYRPEKVVTRAEMAALLIKALGLTPAASSTTNFSDVPASHWASGYVAYANSLGIIAGYTDGTFKPSKTVSYDEAVTMIVQALGYTADSLEGTTWPTAFIMKAQQLKITKGVELLGSVGANRGDIAELLYNTLTVDLGKTNKDGEFVKNSADATKPDNMLTRLGAELGAKKVILGTEDAAIELAEYVGKYVQTYTDEDGIVAVVVLSTKLEGKMSSDEKKFADTAFATDCDKTSLKVQFENGEKGTCADKDATVMEVALDSNGKITTIYSVQKWAGTTFMAPKTAYDTKKFTLTDGTNTYSFKTEEKALVEDSFVLLGADSLDKIAEDDVVTVYVGPTSKNVTKVEVSNKVVTGKLESRTASKITVAGTAYDYESADDELKVGTEYNVYFDYAGDVAFVKVAEAKATDKAYAVILAANYETTGDGWSDTSKTVTKQVKLLLTTGEEVTYDVVKDAAAPLDFTDSKDFITKNGGKLITYQLKEEKLFSIAAVEGTDVKADTKKVNKNSTLDGYYFADNAVAFVKTTKADSYKYAVVTADKLAEMGLEDAYFVLNAKGQIEVLHTGATVAAEPDVYGIYTGEWTETKDGYSVSFYVDGALVQYTAKATTKPAFEAGVFSTITFDGNKVVGVTEVTTKAAITTGGSLTGNTYKEKATDGKAVGLDAKVVVYIWDGEELTLGTIDDLTSSKNTDINLYDMTGKDTIYDVVVITR